MKRFLSSRSTILLMLLLGAASTALGADRFYTTPLNIEPGDSRTIAFCLDNSQEFCGFQADVRLPVGLEVVIGDNGKADCGLSPRADSSYTVVTNLISPEMLRVGAFSTSHIPIAGESGEFMFLNIHASDTFEGGELTISDILFTDASNNDVELPDFTVAVGNEYQNSFFIPDFNIAVGETKEITLILDNEAPFTAFQTDILLPEGLEFVEHSPAMTSRGTDHTLTAKAFGDGRVRLTCLSLSNATFVGNEGGLATISVTASKDIASNCSIEMQNQRFSTPAAKEYLLANSMTSVSTERVLVESISLNQESIELNPDEGFQLEATLLPSDASTPHVEWKSNDPYVATVNEEGYVKAIAPGEALISVSATDGSGICASCQVSVKGIPASGVAILNPGSQTLKIGESIQLTAQITPENATDKTLSWFSSDEVVATVDGTGCVTANNVGHALISVVTSSGAKDEMEFEVVGEISEETLVWNQEFRCEVGESVVLDAHSTADAPVIFSNARIGGGYHKAEFEEKDGLWIATFPEAGPYVLRAECDNQAIEKRFNVVPSHEGLSNIDGLYYRYADGENSTLKVVYGYEMYAGDYNLSSIVEGIPVISIDDFAFYCCEDLSRVTLAEGISSLGQQPFGASSLSYISIPSTVASVGERYPFNALLGDLSRIDLRGEEPPYADETTFNGFVDYENCELHVPEGRTDTYRSAPIWSNFARIIDDLPAAPTASVRIYGGNRTIREGEQIRLKALVIPEDRTDEVSWSSSDPGVVSVDEDGVITGMEMGTATIYAEVDGCLGEISVMVEIADNLIETPINSSVVVRVSDSGLRIDGLVPGNVVRLCRLDGVVVFEQSATSPNITIPVVSKGIYLLRMAGQSYKVIF